MYKTQSKFKHLWAVVFLLIAFIALSLIAIIDYQFLGGNVFNQFVVSPVRNLLNFMRAQFLESSAQDKANFMLIGTSIGLYVFLAFIFYSFIRSVIHKRDSFDDNYRSSAPKDKLVLFITSLLFKNIIIGLGLFTFYVIMLAFLTQIAVN